VINVFEKFAPRYKRATRRFALDVWKSRAPKQRLKKFLAEAEKFKRQYERALIQHYRDIEMKIFPGTITAKANQWLTDQNALAESIVVIAKAKKQNLIADEFEKLRADQNADVQKVLNRIYLSKKDIEAGGEVYRVFSFAENLEKRAEQMGEDAAFDLGREVNNAVLAQSGDMFGWESQRDKAVRKTHRKLRGKTFLFSDPPTTVDKYGNRHTGLCGTDWGCRCYAVAPFSKKPLRNYVVVEKRDTD